MGCHTWYLILRRKTVINAPWSCLGNTAFTARITAAACIPGQRPVHRCMNPCEMALAIYVASWHAQGKRLIGLAVPDLPWMEIRLQVQPGLWESL